MAMLCTCNLKKYYKNGQITTKALDDVTLEVGRREFVAIVGPSGSGKTTLLHLLGGLDVPTAGTVEIDGMDICQMKEDQLTRFRRRRIGFIFQTFNLIPILNVYENIVLPLRLDSRKVDQGCVDDIVKALGIHDKRAAFPNQLSGGQQQRVAIARALVARPSIILADEPTGNLDRRTSNDVLDVIRLAKERYGQTIVMITHNPDYAKIADRIICIEDGKIIC